MNRGLNKRGHYFLIILLLICLDRVVKSILINFPQNQPILVVIPDFFKIQTLINKGIAFGLFPSLSDFFLWLNLIIIVYILYLFISGKSGKLFLSLSLILAGAISNLIDRFLYGGVLDYLDFSFWPTFNLADSYITIGIILILKDAFFERKKRV